MSLRSLIFWRRSKLAHPAPMTEIGERERPLRATPSDASINKLHRLHADYDNIVTQFYDFLPTELRPTFVEDALYHKARYLDMLAMSSGNEIVEVGSDKPFVAHMLRMLNPSSSIRTISIDVPFTPYPLIRLDIESEDFPFEDNSIDQMIFTEVLEHLFRDPAWPIFQINRSLKPGGMLFLTTPNACGYDCLINFLNQTNPNGRNQFFEAIESGHPHLWTASECRLLLHVHGFEIVAMSTTNYYDIPKPEKIQEFLNKYSTQPDMHEQVLRVVAIKKQHVKAAVYPPEIFPGGRPVQLTGALRRWIESNPLPVDHS